MVELSRRVGEQVGPIRQRPAGRVTVVMPSVVATGQRGVPRPCRRCRRPVRGSTASGEGLRRPKVRRWSLRRGQVCVTMPGDCSGLSSFRAVVERQQVRVQMFDLTIFEAHGDESLRRSAMTVPLLPRGFRRRHTGPIGSLVMTRRPVRHFDVTKAVPGLGSCRSVPRLLSHWRSRRRPGGAGGGRSE